MTNEGDEIRSLIDRFELLPKQEKTSNRIPPRICNIKIDLHGKEKGVKFTLCSLTAFIVEDFKEYRKKMRREGNVPINWCCSSVCLALI